MSTFSEPPYLNRRIAAYSEHADEQAAYELMQLISFEVAELLMKHPRGTMAAGIQGHGYWVSEVDGMVELFCTPDYEPSIPDDCNVFAVSGFEGQSVVDLHACRQAMEAWLAAPVLVSRPVKQLDAMVGKMLASHPLDSASQVPGIEVAPDCERVTKVTQNLQRPDGSQVRIVAEEFYGRGLHPSIDVFVLKRESKDHAWVLCSDRPASNWRSMSVEEYKLHGRSPMLQAASPGEVLRAISAIGRPLAEFQESVPESAEPRNGYSAPRM